jgi:hypothetical protein
MGGAPLCVCRWQGWSADGQSSEAKLEVGTACSGGQLSRQIGETSGGALVPQVMGAGRVKGIRWGWPRNCRLNGKTERNRRDERDGVLTFGQRWTTATEELAGVAESPELGKMTESTSDSRDRPSRRRARRWKLQGGVPLHRKCSVSPEVRRNLVDAKVRWGFVGSRVIETGWGWRRWKEDAKEIAGNYLLAEIESDFIFLFLISKINFGLKIIFGNPEIIIKSRKILWKLR